MGAAELLLGLESVFMISEKDLEGWNDAFLSGIVRALVEVEVGVEVEVEG